MGDINVKIRDSYKWFVYFSWNQGKKKQAWIPTKFHKYLCDRVQAFLDDRTPGVRILCISTPPQHGKSATISERLGAWYLLNHPDDHVILVSYGDVLAKRFGKQNLNTLKQFAPSFGVTLDPGRATSQDMYIKDHDGYMISRGYGAALTGYSGDLIIIDDPVKNAEEASSEANRESKWNEFLSTIMTRQQDVTRIVLIMTRWHEDDLAGRIQQDMGSMCEVVNIPCECESDDDLLGRKIGEPLCPELGKDETWLEATKKAYVTENGQRAWDALYQGRPSAMEGNLLKREDWQYFSLDDYKKDLMPLDRVIMSVDATYKDAKHSDFVAIQVWGKHKDSYYLLDRSKKRMTFTQTLNEIERMKRNNPRVRQIYIEDKANGSAIIDVLREKIGGIVAVEPKESKYARVEAVAFIQQMGNCYLPEKCGWVFEFINECATFPNGAHDDEVDAFSPALNKLRKSRKRLPKPKFVDLTGWGIEQPEQKGEIGERINVI
jgi:predicted phage terminase large subunit-like protein